MNENTCRIQEYFISYLKKQSYVNHHARFSFLRKQKVLQGGRVSAYEEAALVNTFRRVQNL